MQTKWGTVRVIPCYPICTLKASSAPPQLPPCSFTPSVPAPWDVRPSQVGHTLVKSGVPSLTLALNSTATPGLWPSEAGKFSRVCRYHLPRGCRALIVRQTPFRTHLQENTRQPRMRHSQECEPSWQGVWPNHLPSLCLSFPISEKKKNQTPVNSPTLDEEISP